MARSVGAALQRAHRDVRARLRVEAGDPRRVGGREDLVCGRRHDEQPRGRRTRRAAAVAVAVTELRSGEQRRRGVDPRQSLQCAAKRCVAVAAAAADTTNANTTNAARCSHGGRRQRKQSLVLRRQPPAAGRRQPNGGSRPVSGSGFWFCIIVLTKSNGSEKAEAKKPAMAEAPSTSG